MGEEQQNNPVEAIKSLTIVVPLAASSIAGLYDVGFFLGIDISFFTFFSITEHFVFALQAIPFALPPAVMLCAWAVSVRYSEIRVAKDNENFRTQIDAITNRTLLLKIRKTVEKEVTRNKWILAFVALSLGIGSLMGIVIHNYTLAFLAAVPIFYRFFWIRLSTIPWSNWFAATFIVGTVAFLVGYDRANAILTTARPTENISTSDKVFQARIIRAGEKGLLFFSTDEKKTRFLRWETVKQIETL